MTVCETNIQVKTSTKRQIVDGNGCFIEVAEGEHTHDDACGRLEGGCGKCVSVELFCWLVPR